jgi:hypothetical protein
VTFKFITETKAIIPSPSEWVVIWLFGRKPEVLPGQEETLRSWEAKSN